MATSGHTTCARVNFAQTISVVRTHALRDEGLVCATFSVDPVTSVVPTQDESTYLVMTLDGHIRLMDAFTGKVLNDFSGHAHTSYRCRACFGHGEASIVAGDENGAVWAWDLLDVSYTRPSCAPMSNLLLNAGQASST
jgi:mitogen-activated protein kinase organizer 1